MEKKVVEANKKRKEKPPEPLRTIEGAEMGPADIEALEMIQKGSPPPPKQKLN